MPIYQGADLRSELPISVEDEDDKWDPIRTVGIFYMVLLPVLFLVLPKLLLRQ